MGETSADPLEQEAAEHQFAEGRMVGAGNEAAAKRVGFLQAQPQHRDTGTGEQLLELAATGHGGGQGQGTITARRIPAGKRCVAENQCGMQAHEIRRAGKKTTGGRHETPPALAGQAEHQMRPHPHVKPPQQLDRPQRGSRVMAAATEGEHLIVKALHADLHGPHPIIGEQAAGMEIQGVGPGGQADGTHLAPAEPRLGGGKQLFLLAPGQGGKRTAVKGQLGRPATRRATLALARQKRPHRLRAQRPGRLARGRWLVTEHTTVTASLLGQEQRPYWRGGVRGSPRGGHRQSLPASRDAGAVRPGRAAPGPGRRRTSRPPSWTGQSPGQAAAPGTGPPS